MLCLAESRRTPGLLADEQGDDHRVPPRSGATASACPERRAAGDASHGKPPFGEGPGGSLARGAVCARSRRVVGRRRRGRGSRRPAAVRSGRSAVMPTALRGPAPGRAVPRRASTASRRARWRRDFAVPSGIPGRRDLGQRHPQEVVERHDRAMVGIEAPERLRRAARGRRRAAVGAEGTNGGELDLDRRAAPAPGDVETGVDGQSVEPGVEPVGISQPRQVPPGRIERVLDRVARELRVPEDQAGRRVQPRDAAPTSAAKAS